MDLPPLTFLLTYAGIQVLASISPGPAFAVVTQKSLQGGQRSGFAAAAGCAVGAAIWLSATMVGLTFLLSRFWWLYTGLRVAGGVFLIYLAVQLWRHAKDSLPPIETDVVATRPNVWRDFRAALFVQLSNPKALAFCTSVLVTILPPTPPLWLKIAVPAIGSAIEGLWWFFLATAFSTGAFRHRYSQLKSDLDRMMGATLGLLGIKLLVNQT